MKKILLVIIIKNPTDSELQHPERLISTQTAQIEKIPFVGDEFKPITESGSLAVYNCLRIEQYDSQTPCDVVDGHDAIIYATISHHLSVDHSD